MPKRFRLAGQQLQHLWFEIKRMNAGRIWRWFGCWFSTSLWVVASYRIERALFLLLGPAWSLVRIVLSPLIFLLRPWLNPCEINYQANIGRGLIVLHPTLGIVVSKYAVIGKDCVLTGGNCIGGKGDLNFDNLRIGDNANIGANASVIGPAIIGNDVYIGAGAVVVKDAPDGAVLVGVPARALDRSKRVAPAAGEPKPIAES